MDGIGRAGALSGAADMCDPEIANGQVEEDGEGKSEWEKQQDMTDTPLCLPLLP
jgi:hypothetical protein